MLSIRYNERYFIENAQFSIEENCLLSECAQELLRALSNKPGDTNNGFKSWRLSLAYEELKQMPREITSRFNDLEILDLSYNKIRKLSFLSKFHNLHSLILDKNINLDLSTLPDLPQLHLLWMNNCNLSGLISIIVFIAKKCPNLKILSLMGNPCTLELDDFEYRRVVASNMSELEFLDDKIVDSY